MMSNPKNKGTLFSSTSKVEEKKVLLFFLSEDILVRYGDFEFLTIFPFLGQEWQSRRGGAYLWSDPRDLKLFMEHPYMYGN